MVRLNVVLIESWLPSVKRFRIVPLNVRIMSIKYENFTMYFTIFKNSVSNYHKTNPLDF